MALHFGDVLLAVIAFLTWRTYLRIEWYTGSMDSYQQLLVRIEAERLNREAQNPDSQIELIWWDPSGRKPKWPESREHEQPATLNRITLGIPRDMRADQPTLRKDVCAAWRNALRYVFEVRVPD